MAAIAAGIARAATATQAALPTDDAVGYAFLTAQITANGGNPLIDNAGLPWPIFDELWTPMMSQTTFLAATGTIRPNLPPVGQLSTAVGGGGMISWIMATAGEWTLHTGRHRINEMLPVWNLMVADTDQHIYSTTIPRGTSTEWGRGPVGSMFRVTLSKSVAARLGQTHADIDHSVPRTLLVTGGSAVKQADLAYGLATWGAFARTSMATPFSSATLSEFPIALETHLIGSEASGHDAIAKTAGLRAYARDQQKIKEGADPAGKFQSPEIAEARFRRGCKLIVKLWREYGCYS